MHAHLCMSVFLITTSHVLAGAETCFIALSISFEGYGVGTFQQSQQAATIEAALTSIIPHLAYSKQTGLHGTGLSVTTPPLYDRSALRSE